MRSTWQAGRRPWVAAGLALVAAAVLLALAAGPAAAFSRWSHGGTAGCSCHVAGRPTDASCTGCHAGFVSYPGLTCWSCHAPGESTAALKADSAACSQGCHLYRSLDKAYTVPYAHPADPHRGAAAGCLSCHGTSPAVTEPGTSPHHSGVDTGFSACTACHGGYQRHAGAVACATCHARAAAYHLYASATLAKRGCRACHARNHAGEPVPGSACRRCHKGSGAGPAAAAQHSAGVTSGRACRSCHDKALHASAYGSAISSCRSCHAGLFHAAQRLPGAATCLRCHSAASHHAAGVACRTCHKRAIHAARPTTR